MMSKNLIFMGLAAISLLAVGCATAGDGDVRYADSNSYALSGERYGAGTAAPQQGGDQFGEFADNPFVSTALQPVSTFSVDADGASYAIMRRYLANGWKVSPSSVRIEEFLNYFTFNYPAPRDGQSVAISAEAGECPWNAEHHLLRLGIKGKELTAGETPRANFVFLIDVSGSMASPDKIDLLKSGLTALLYQLSPSDRVSIVTYSGTVQKLLESTPVREADKIRAAIARLSASGATAGGEALKMAYEEALANYDPDGNNRVIMGTDGDFNVGVTSISALVEMVQEYAGKGIYMTCLGFGSGNLNDAMMEQVSNAGNGTYHYIDCEDELMKVFVHERGQFVSVASDAKCQLTFDPAVVSQYRLIGYENRVMSQEDFDDDRKDAGEIGAGQTITALYEVVLNHEGLSSGHTPVTFDFRYKKSLRDESIPLQLKVTADSFFNKNIRSGEFYFAAGVAAYGMLLRDSPYKGSATIQMAKELAGKGLDFDAHGYRAELLKLMEKSTKSQ